MRASGIKVAEKENSFNGTFRRKTCKPGLPIPMTPEKEPAPDARDILSCQTSAPI